MSRAPESYPEQTVAQWVAANDAHVLPSLQVAEPIQWPAQPAQVDYEAQMALGRKMRAAAFRTLFRGLGQLLFKTAPQILARLWVSLAETATKRRRERQVQWAVSRLSPHILADIGLESWQRAGLRSGRTRSSELIHLNVWNKSDDPF